MAVQQAFANQKNTQTIDELKVIDRVDSKAQELSRLQGVSWSCFAMKKLITAGTVD